MDTKTKETLQKQLQLLSERSQNKEIDICNLIALSDSIVRVALAIPQDVDQSFTL